MFHEVLQRGGYWRLKWTLIRGCPGDHDPDVKEKTDNCERHNDTRDKRINRPHVPRKTTSKEKEGYL